MATPTSKSTIANMALSHLKVDNVLSIDPPDEDSTPAATAAFWYDQARRDTLEAHPWNFAAKRVEIASEATEPLFEYSTKYELPSDFVRVIRLGENWDDPTTDYEIEGNYILCDVETPLQLVYVSNIETVSRFSPQFITAMSYRLAQFMGFKLTGNAQMVEAMEAVYTKCISTAMSIDGQNRPTRRVENSKLRNARNSTSRARNWRAW